MQFAVRQERMFYRSPTFTARRVYRVITVYLTGLLTVQYFPLYARRCNLCIVG